MSDAAFAFFAAFLRDLCEKAFDREGRKELPQRTRRDPRFGLNHHGKLFFIFSIAFGILLSGATEAQDQPAKSAAPPAQKEAAQKDTDADRAYSGTYTFLKEGEFVQLTVEDERRVTGFISRYGEGESDKGTFLDQFFKSAKLEGNKLNFTTEIVHGISFDFRGTVERGEGKNPGDEAYFVLKGWLTENSSDVNKKVTSQSQEVAFRMFPQDAK